MELSNILEEDKDRVVAAVADAASPQQVPKILEDELDKLLIRYNEQCENENARRTAAAMIQAAKSCLPLVYAHGDPKIWQASASDLTGSGASQAPRSHFFIPVLTAGAVCGLLSTLIPSLSPQIASMAGLPVLIILAAVSIGLCLLAGRLSAGKTALPGASQQPAPVRVDIPADPVRIWHSLHALALLMDQNLTEIIASDEWEKRNRKQDEEDPCASPVMKEPELKLFSSLLEARYSGDAEYALEKLSEIPYYLHQNGIETIEYNQENADLFDLLPGDKPGTVRPALLSSGRLLSRGLAIGSSALTLPDPDQNQQPRRRPWGMQ